MVDNKPHSDCFRDRRNHSDRRQGRSKQQAGQCRRRRDRRQRQYSSQPWWLLTNYVEVINPRTFSRSLKKQDD